MHLYYYTPISGSNTLARVTTASLHYHALPCDAVTGLSLCNEDLKVESLFNVHGKIGAGATRLSIPTPLTGSLSHVYFYSILSSAPFTTAAPLHAASLQPL